MGRVDYYHDPDAPDANSLVVGSSAIVVDDENLILLQRRSDSGNWALPGGVMDIGETLAECAIREVREETGPVSSRTSLMAHSASVSPMSITPPGSAQLPESLRRC